MREGDRQEPTGVRDASRIRSRGSRQTCSSLGWWEAVALQLSASRRSCCPWCCLHGLGGETVGTGNPGLAQLVLDRVSEGRRERITQLSL